MSVRRLVLVTALTAVAMSAFPATPVLAAGDSESGTESLRTFGDIMQIALPVIGGGSTLFTNPEEGKRWDREGTKQFAYSYGFSWATTYLIKIGAGKMRPNGDNRTSFPSGHTMSAFAGASFIDARYGRWWGIPSYACALVTGYSRVESQWHFADDVLAGASIGMLYTWHFVTPQPGKVQLIPTVGAQGMGMAVTVNPGAEEEEEWSLAQRRSGYFFMFGPAAQVFNRVLSTDPGSTEFNLADLEGSNDPTTTAGVDFGLPLGSRGRLHINYAPFEARDRGSFGYDVNFGGNLYPAGTEVESQWLYYQLNTYYRHAFPLGSKFTFDAGGGLGGQRSRVSLQEKGGSKPVTLKDRVIYPLIVLDLQYQFAKRWALMVRTEGVVSSGEYTDTYNAILMWQVGRHWDFNAMYTYFSRAIDQDQMRNEVDYRIAQVGVTRYW